MENLSIDIIWEMCLSNNRKAQYQLYQRYSKKMYAVCLRYAQDSSEAEDMLQIGFLKVFSKGQLYDGKGSLEGWIRRVMVNAAIEIHRKHKIKFTEPLGEQHEQLWHSSCTADNSKYTDLLQLVQQLPIGYKTVFNLYAIEGYGHKEIADMLAISEGTSKSQLSRARQWLKEKLVTHNM